MLLWNRFLIFDFRMTNFGTPAAMAFLEKKLPQARNSKFNNRNSKMSPEVWA